MKDLLRMLTLVSEAKSRIIQLVTSLMFSDILYSLNSNNDMFCYDDISSYVR